MKHLTSNCFPLCIHFSIFLVIIMKNVYFTFKSRTFLLYLILTKEQMYNWCIIVTFVVLFSFFHHIATLLFWKSCPQHCCLSWFQTPAPAYDVSSRPGTRVSGEALVAKLQSGVHYEKHERLWMVKILASYLMENCQRSLMLSVTGLLFN